MVESFAIDLSQVQPSQLFVSAAKLQRVLGRYDTQNAAFMAPIPVKHLGENLIFTDGHTRALAAHLRGEAEIRVVWDEDDLDWETHEICVGWCKQEGIRHIADLEDRVISSDEYEVLWLQRSQAMQRNLELSRAQDGEG